MDFMLGDKKVNNILPGTETHRRHLTSVLRTIALGDEETQTKVRLIKSCCRQLTSLLKILALEDEENCTSAWSHPWNTTGI